MPRTGRPRQERPVHLNQVKRKAAAQELKALRERARPRLTQDAVAAALGLSAATVRGWESAKPGREPTRDQAALLDEYFAGKLGREFEEASILRSWGWPASPSEGGESVDEEGFADSEANAVATQAFNFTLDSEVGLSSSGRPYLADTVVSNLRSGTSYEYVLAPPANWIEYEDWWNYISQQIVQFEQMCLHEAGYRVLSRVSFIFLATYADLNYSFDIHHIDQVETVAFICEEVPNRDRLKGGTRMLVKLNDPDKLLSVWTWLQTISRDFGISYSPLKNHLEPLAAVRQKYFDRFDPIAGDWEFIRHLIQAEVRMQWTQRHKASVS